MRCKQRRKIIKITAAHFITKSFVKLCLHVAHRFINFEILKSSIRNIILFENNERNYSQQGSNILQNY